MYLRNALLAVGLLALAAGVVLAGIWIRESTSSDSNGSGATAAVSILVASANILPGTLLRAEDMSWKDVPAAEIPPAAVRKAPGAEEAFLGAVTHRRFAAGDPIVASGLVKPGDRGFLAAVLAPNMRAVSVSVDASTSTAGLIQPGDYVDVMLAHNVDQSGTERDRGVVGETVLQNVRVIAVDQWFAASGRPIAATGPIGTVESRIPKTVTLEVDEENAKRLLVAAQMGKVTLAMRALEGSYGMPARTLGDTEPVFASDVSAALRGGGSRLATDTTPASGLAAARRPVVIMRGSKVESQ